MMLRIEYLTEASSTLIRIFAYVFLRWIPSPHILRITWTLVALYLPVFTWCFYVLPKSTKILKRSRDGRTEGKGKASMTDFDSNENRQESLQNRRGARRIRTILLGAASPQSVWFSLGTFLVNLFLVLAITDLTYRAKVMLPSHDLSFARVGYISTSEARLLIREPDQSQLPVSALYRKLDTQASDNNAPWTFAGSLERLENESDYSGVIDIDLPESPNQVYQWKTSNNHTGSFATPPAVGNTPRDGFTFLSTSCIKPRFPYNPLDHGLSMPGFRHLSNVIKAIPGGAQFMLFLGDFIYIDVPIKFGISDKEDYRREYRQVYASPDWPLVGQNMSWIHVIDDHEISNDWDQGTTGVFEAAMDPWHNYHTAVNPPLAREGGSTDKIREGATYYEFTQGPASFFMLDTRTYRDPSGSLTTGLPADHATKSMLGAQQLSDLLGFLHRTEPNGVKWKFVISSIPFTKNWRVNSLDTWAGYLVERQTILEAMWDAGQQKGVGVVVLSGDRHEFAATAFPPPPGGKWPKSATVHEFSTSPLSQFYLPIPTYRQRDDEDVMLKYIPNGNSKVGAITIFEDTKSNQSRLKFRMYVDGLEAWSTVILSPPS